MTLKRKTIDSYKYRDKMMESWMIINNESEQFINNAEGSTLMFSSPEQAESFILDQGINGTIVKIPDVTEGIP